MEFFNISATYLSEATAKTIGFADGRLCIKLVASAIEYICPGAKVLLNQLLALRRRVMSPKPKHARQRCSRSLSPARAPVKTTEPAPHPAAKQATAKDPATARDKLRAVVREYGIDLEAAEAGGETLREVLSQMERLEERRAQRSG